VLHAARKQFFAVHLKPLAVHVLGTYPDFGGADYLLANVRKLRQPSSSYILLPEDDLGIDEHQLFLRLLAMLRSITVTRFDTPPVVRPIRCL